MIIYRNSIGFGSEIGKMTKGAIDIEDINLLKTWANFIVGTHAFWWLVCDVGREITVLGNVVPGFIWNKCMSPNILILAKYICLIVDGSIANLHYKKMVFDQRLVIR